jgi:uncharacterized protein YfbU (UPF0304 family)
MRIDKIIEDPFQRWDKQDLNFDMLKESELQTIIDLSEVAEEHTKDPEGNRPLSKKEKIELNRIFRKAANNGRRLFL